MTRKEIAEMCGCEPAEVRTASLPGDRIGVTVVVRGAGKPTVRLAEGSSLADAGEQLRAYVQRRKATHGKRGEVIDTDAIDPGEDNPTPRRSGPTLLERIEALESRGR